MSDWSIRSGLAWAAVLAMALVADAAESQTFTLELKRLGPQSTGMLSVLPGDYIYRFTYPQSFFMQLGAGVQPTSPSSADFSKIVKKEPAKYHSEHPFRGVAVFGSHQYAFVLDAKDANSRGYGRLYFDRNHNGDLTDDKVIDGEAPKRFGFGLASNYWPVEFPRVDLTIDAGGSKVEYAFFLQVYSYRSDELSYASVSINAAAYRAGEIIVDGKTHRVALVDFNSNGRFDDRTTIPEGAESSRERLYPDYGDMLLIDPGTGSLSSPYDVTGGEERQFVSGLVNIDGRYYELKVPPAGDKLTLTPSSRPTGLVTNPNGPFRAVVYGDQGLLKIRGSKSEPVPLPAGQWKLMAYTIDRTGMEEAEGKAKKADQEEPEERSLLERLAGALFGGGSDEVARGPLATRVSAQATPDYKPVTVREGQTVVMPFGPPYRPVVKVSHREDAERVSLELSLVGSAGEICNDLMVRGRRPQDPRFTIVDPEGNEVARGKFEYG